MSRRTFENSLKLPIAKCGKIRWQNYNFSDKLRLTEMRAGVFIPVKIT